MTTGKQHVEKHRKLALRNALLKYAATGAAYVPFCGDGDMAVECYYQKGNVTKIFAADLDPERTKTFATRCPESIIATGNCDVWPFADDLPDPFAIADFDAYAYPYDSFRAFFENAKLAPRLVLFFTDGQRLNVRMPGSTGVLHYPDGSKKRTRDMVVNEPRRIFNFYMKEITLPWLAKVCANRWTINMTKFYLRDSMVYWGAVITRK